MSLRVAVIGAHRRRTGTGPFVSGFFRRAGCVVEAWDRAQSAAFLEPGWNAGGLDAVAICSPAETHMAYLAAAIEKGLHVFCEKPVVWPADGRAESLDVLLAALAESLERARRSALVVHENAQWIYTLDAFRGVAADIQPPEVRSFRCEMSPSTGTAAEMVMECAAHPNSLLLALGAEGVRDARVRYTPPGAASGATIEIDFVSTGAAGQPVEAGYRFTQQSAQPRHAAYEINDRRVERRVEVNGYRIFLVCEGRETLVPDPVEASVNGFLRRVAGPVAGRQPASAIPASLRMSLEILRATERVCA